MKHLYKYDVIAISLLEIAERSNYRPLMVLSDYNCSLCIENEYW